MCSCADRRCFSEQPGATAIPRQGDARVGLLTDTQQKWVLRSLHPWDFCWCSAWLCTMLLGGWMWQNWVLLPLGRSCHSFQRLPAALIGCALLTGEAPGWGGCGINFWLREQTAVGEVKGDQPQPDSRVPGHKKEPESLVCMEEKGRRHLFLYHCPSPCSATELQRSMQSHIPNGTGNLPHVSKPSLT